MPPKSRKRRNTLPANAFRVNNPDSVVQLRSGHHQRHSGYASPADAPWHPVQPLQQSSLDLLLNMPSNGPTIYNDQNMSSLLQFHSDSEWVSTGLNALNDDDLDLLARVLASPETSSKHVNVNESLSNNLHYSESAGQQVMDNMNATPVSNVVGDQGSDDIMRHCTRSAKIKANTAIQYQTKRKADRDSGWDDDVESDVENLVVKKRIKMQRNRNHSSNSREKYNRLRVDLIEQVQQQEQINKQLWKEKDEVFAEFCQLREELIMHTCDKHCHGLRLHVCCPGKCFIAAAEYLSVSKYLYEELMTLNNLRIALSIEKSLCQDAGIHEIFQTIGNDMSGLLQLHDGDDNAFLLEEPVSTSSDWKCSNTS